MNVILPKPIITEKSMELARGGWYAFAVRDYTRKPAIAKAIADIYNVQVVDVRTMSMHGKMRKAGKRMKLVARPDWKKTLVKLAKGQTIPAFDISTQQESEAK